MCGRNMGVNLIVSFLDLWSTLYLLLGENIYTTFYACETSYVYIYILFCLTKEFTGNTDENSIVFHDLIPPIRARYIRFRPTAWHQHISMRVELYGCCGTLSLKSVIYYCHIFFLVLLTKHYSRTRDQNCFIVCHQHFDTSTRHWSRSVCSVFKSGA